jgi:hypothetical protein
MTLIVTAPALLRLFSDPMSTSSRRRSAARGCRGSLAFRSARPIAGDAVVEAYRRVMWTAALAVAAALMALAWFGNEPPKRQAN